MERLTLREFKKRIERHIEEFGDMPITLSDGKLTIPVEDGQTILLAYNAEMPDKSLKNLITESDLEFEEHEYYKLGNRWWLNHLNKHDNQSDTQDYLRKKFKKMFP